MRAGPIDNGFDRIFETWRLRHNAILWQSLDCSYLGFALPDPDNVANRLAEKRPGERRNVRYCSARGEGLRYQPDFFDAAIEAELVARIEALPLQSIQFSRQVWEHSIPAVEQRRYSITFRTMKTDKAGIPSRSSAAS